MNKAQIRTMIYEYIKDNLSISANRKTEFGPVEIIELELWLGDKMICKEVVEID